MSTLGVYRRILGSRIRGQVAYPASFAMDVVAQLLAQGIELVVILVLFTQVRTLGGFAGPEVLLMYGLSAIAFGLADLLFGGAEELSDQIRRGEFDVLLLRPLGTLPQLLTLDVGLRRLGRAGVGLGVYLWALAALEPYWTPARAALAVTAPLVGAAILGAIFVATNSVSFWLVDGQEVANAFTYGSNFSTSYPITVYGPWLRRLLCFAVPSAFVAYFPALALLDRPDPLGLPSALRWCGPVAALAAAGVAALVWRAGVRHYQGTGS